MSAAPKLYIAGMGMITPVGFDTASTAAAVRAGVSGYQISHYLNNNCKPITMASVPDEALPEIAYPLQNDEYINVPNGRMLLMAHMALGEALRQYSTDRPLPLMLAGPMPYDGQEAPFCSKFIDILVTQAGVNLDRNNCRIITTGRSGVFSAIDMARKYLEHGIGDYVLVGGVDSYQDYPRLLKLDEQGRIKAEGETNGFVPGEAAGFILLTNKYELAGEFSAGKFALSEPAVAEEAGHLYSEATYTGNGLADAFRLAIKKNDNKSIGAVFSGMNGEHFWAKEFGVAMIRNSKNIWEDATHVHPADCFGDLGAAMGAVLIGMVCELMKDSPKKDVNLIACSSDHSQRAALCAEFVS